MGLRELKETAHQLFVRGKFAQCAQTYQQVLRLAPRDPNMHVRHAEACRRVGDRLQAIASYRAAANLLLELGCESRARGALKAALELDPRDPLLQADVARLGPNHEDSFSTGFYGERDELPLLPPLESGLDPVPPPPPAPRPMRVPRHEELLRTPSLPPIHRALPSAPSVPPPGPPVLLPAPSVRSVASGTAPAASASRTEKLGASLASAAGALPRPLPPRAVATGRQASAPRPGQASGFQPPVLHPVDAASLPPRSVTTGPQASSAQPEAALPPRAVTTGTQVSSAQPFTALPPHSAKTGSQVQAARAAAPPILTPRSVTDGIQASASMVPAASLHTASQAPGKAMAPPPPPAEALIEATRGGPRLEVRRLSSSALAFRSSPNDSWAVIRSHTPLELHLVEDLEKLPPMMRDFSPEITVEAAPEAASSTVH